MASQAEVRSFCGHCSANARVTAVMQSWLLFPPMLSTLHMPSNLPSLPPSQAEYNRVSLSVNEQGAIVAPPQGNLSILGLQPVGGWGRCLDALRSGRARRRMGGPHMRDAFRLFSADSLLSDNPHLPLAPIPSHSRPSRMRWWAARSPISSTCTVTSALWLRCMPSCWPKSAREYDGIGARGLY